VQPPVADQRDPVARWERSRRVDEFFRTGRRSTGVRWKTSGELAEDCLDGVDEGVAVGI
jgi:hypothetical protein